MAKREFKPEDYENAEAPEGERRLRRDHIEVRDLSYEVTRTRQQLDLMKHSMFDMGFEGFGPEVADENIPRDRLDVYVKEVPPGPGYVADIVYSSKDLPVTVYAILANDGSGLAIAELELWRESWRHEQDQDGNRTEEPDEDDPPVRVGMGITADVLRRIPIGMILGRAQAQLSRTDWQEEGITVLMGPDRGPDELTEAETRALNHAVASAGMRRKKGRPPLSDGLLAEVSRQYLVEAEQGRGLTGRLAEFFNRPEPTVRDWIAAARSRGFLSPAVPGRRSASPGPRLSTPNRAT